MKKGKSILVIIALIIGLAWVGGISHKSQGTSQISPQINQALEGICIDDLYKHILFLASDDLQGRPTPSIYCDIAGRYIGEQFWEYNLRPGGNNNSFEQYYTINIYPDNRENLRVSFSFGDYEWELDADEIVPYFHATTGTSLSFEGSIVYTGYGIIAHERGHNDYENLDVRGKVVLFMEGAPWEVNYDSIIAYDKRWMKRTNAAQHGAVGFIYGAYLLGNQQRESAGFPDNLTNGYYLQRRSLNPQIRRSVPGIYLPMEYVWEIANSASSNTLNSSLNVSSEDRKALDILSGGLRFSVRLDVNPIQQQTFNVIGILRGTDPELANEYIAITAHYDHVIGNPVNGDSIYNGADDNASGTAGVLELAQAFSSLPTVLRPRRSIIFLLTSGEESGIFGSSHFVENPTVPISRIKANINLDMIGRYREIGLKVYAAGSDRLGEIMCRDARSYGLNTILNPNPESRIIYRSDNFPFNYRNIPAVFCHTGAHPDLHRPSDEIDKINFPDMEKIVRAAFLTTLELANRDTIPGFIPPAYFVVRP